MSDGITKMHDDNDIARSIAKKLNIKIEVGGCIDKYYVLELYSHKKLGRKN